MDHLTASWTALLEMFRPCFRAEVFQTFSLMLPAWIACLGRRTISRVWETTGQSDLRCHCPAFRLFSEAQWNWDELGRILLVRLLAVCVPGTRVWLVVDDTLCHKRGVFCETLPGSGIDPDLLRAYLAATIPETADSEFQWDEFMARANGEVIGKFGNFVHRSLTFIWSKFDRSVTRPEAFSAEEEAVLAEVRSRIAEVERCFEELRLRQAYSEVMGIADVANKYFNDAKPWATLKTDAAAARGTLYMCGQLCKILTQLMAPFTPGAAAQIWQQLGMPGAVDEPGSWDRIGELDLPQELTLTQPPTIPFVKITPEMLTHFKEQAMATRDLADFFPKRDGTTPGE